jgi:DNA-binding FadR family transcriptional regulator
VVTTSKSTVVRVPKAGEMVAAQLRRQIVLGELKEGEALPPEANLMERFGVSRPTLREAFRILESEQIITVRRGARGGARVLVPDERVAGRYAGLLLQYRGVAIADVYEARTVLESSAVALLAERRTAADLRRLEQVVAEGEHLLADPVGYADHDKQFHLLLVNLAGNETLDVLVRMLYHISDSHNHNSQSHNSQSHAYRERQSVEEAGPSAKATQRAHAKLIGMIRERSADKAAEFWHRHLKQTTAHVLRDPAGTLVEVLF